MPPGYPYRNMGRSDSVYDPFFEDPRKQPPMWSDRPAQNFYEGQGHTVSAALVAGTIVGSGFLPIGKGRRLWDKYVPWMRAVEEYSPGAFLRTFQVSNFFSQFESVGAAGRFISPQLLQANTQYSDYLRRLIGEQGGVATAGRLAREGVTLRGGALLWGEGTDIALKYAGAIRTPEEASARLASGLARNLGANIPSAHQFFSKTAPFGLESAVRNPTIGGMPFTIVGGQNIFQHAGRQAAMYGTELVDRFNRLLAAPFEMEPFSSVFGGAERHLKKLPGFKQGFAVAEGTGLQMLGRLGVKYGLGLGAAVMAWQTVDWAARNATALDETLLAEGTTHGIATLGIKASIIMSQVAEGLGLHAYREKQEEIAPGSTSLQKLLAFPLMGGLGATVSSFALKTFRMSRMQFTEGVDAATARKEVVERMGAFSGRGKLAAFGRYVTKPEGAFSRQDWIGKVFRKFATPQGESLSFKFLGKIGPTKLAGLIGATVGAALTTPFLFGALIPGNRPDELKRIYSGEQEVGIRRGRWWEFGRSPYEGARIMYYRPHWYARMRIDAKSKAIYGEDEPSPFGKWWQNEFTYELEKKFYKDRPYPITALPFEDVPLIGPLLAHTIGKLIKPPVLMHEEEWRGGDGSLLVEQPPFGQRVATELGEELPGAPVSPYGIKGLIGEQIYRMTEMIGLPGFVMTSIKEKLTGTPDLFDQQAHLESSRRMFGAERAYWDLELGGGLGTTEALRRLYPHRRRQIPLYNPIRNTMPDWLPGAGARGPDFLHGDPYTAIKEGELRLPGVGYAARFPEMEDIAAEDYPLIHRYRILADVAPYTDKFKSVRKRAHAVNRNKQWDEYEQKIFDTTEEQLKARKVRKEFERYEYLSPMGEVFGEATYYDQRDESNDYLSVLNKMKAEQGESESDGVFNKLFGGYWELLAHNADTAWDQLTPISPGAKLVHTRTAIENYEIEGLYGTANAFWQHPVRDFFQPFAQLVGASLGFKGIPSHVQEVRDLESYFDILEYVKFSRLANMAKMGEDPKALKEFEARKNQTLFGINPFTHNYTSIFRALPRRERDYFNEFSAASTTEERARILEMVPDNEKALYVARWKQAFITDVKKAEKMGLLAEGQLEEAEAAVSKIYAEAKTEGLPKTKELFAEYIKTRLQGENYPDWYRRTKLLTGVPLPSTDWVGWHPSVDLEDVKLKVVQQLGEDMHQYDLWPERARRLLNKGYINERTTRAVLSPEGLTEKQMSDRISKLFLANEMRPDIYSSTSFSQDRGRMNFHIEQESKLSDLMKDLE